MLYDCGTGEGACEFNESEKLELLHSLDNSEKVKGGLGWLEIDGAGCVPMNCCCFAGTE